MKDMDIRQGQEYSMEGAAQTLTEVEEHLDKISRGEYIAFCIGCLRKDARLLKDKGRDCSYKFFCPPDKRVWDTLHRWAWKLQKNLIKLGENKLTEELRNEARILRKVIDGELDAGEIDKIKLDRLEKGYIKENGYIKEV